MDQHSSYPQYLPGLLLLSALAVAGCSDADDGGDDGPVRDDAGAANDAGPVQDARTDAPTGDAAHGPDGEADGAITQVTGDLYAVTSEKRLVLFNRASGALASSVGLSGLGDEQVLGADVRPADRTLYLLGSAGNLYTVDLTSGVATRKSGLTADPADTTEPFSALTGETFGVDFNPVADRLRVISSSGQNLRINVDTGATTSDGVLAPTSPGVSAAAYTNSFASACRTKLFVIDAAAGKLLLQDPPNDGKLSELGALGDVGQAHAFEIEFGAAGSETAWLATTRAGAEHVARLDLSTGAATLLHEVALRAGERIVSIAALPPETPPAQPRGELLALTAGNRLLSFNRAAPGKLCTTTSISGLTGEIVGADVRPADGMLHVLTRQGSLYTLVAETGVATLVSTLAADVGDASDPFGALSGESFGVGFNPVPDRLRIVSSSGQNLRVNVSTGATTTDVALSPAGASLSAVAYTNSFAGAKSTTLYGLDTTADALVRVGASPATGGACPDVGNPNCGVVSAIGSLGVVGDVSAVNGFDIDPLAGTALAALSVGTSTTSSLYSIDLSSGAATSLGAAIGGGERVVGLVLAAQPSLTAYAITSDDKLLTFQPSAPSTPTGNVAISGLQSGEKLLGIDVRPLDGQLYAVGSSARLYRVEVGSGAVREVAMLTSAVGGAPVVLPAASYALDFNPAADALRLVASTGQNYRILPSTRAAGSVGATFIDSNLSPGTSSVSAAAYTQSFAGTTSTTLFVLDGAGLSLQGGVNGTPSPNGGVLTAQGPLGLSPLATAGFDIVGAHSGLALAALSLDGTAYGLYTVNLSSGAATAFNATNNVIGAAASIQGLALTLK